MSKAKKAPAVKKDKSFLDKKEQSKIQKEVKKENTTLEEARLKMKAAASEEIKPEQLNFNSVVFNEGDKKDFIFLGIQEAQDQEGDWYDACLLEDENGSQVINADIVLKNTLLPLAGEAPFAIRVTCSGLVQPKSGNKPYKNLTILRF